MATSEELLKQHEMRGGYSCVAWGYEFIAKWHEVLKLNQFPIQTARPSGMGFSKEDQEWFLKEYGIKTEKRSLTLDELEFVIKEQIEKNLPPIVSIFSRASINYDDRSHFSLGVNLDYHVFAGFYQDGQVQLAGRVYSKSCLVLLPIARIREVHRWSSVFPLAPALVECLLHTTPISNNILP